MQKNKKKTSIPFWVQILAILLLGVLASGIVLLFAPENPQPPSKTNAVKHTVTFAYLDGTVIETKTAEEGKGVFPPVVKTDQVFRGWSAGFNAVKADIEVHPVFHSIQEENLFYFNAVYVKEDTEFSLDLYVGGKVNLSSGTITLSYDPEVLTYKRADGLEGVAISESTAGELTIQFHSAAALREKTRIAQIQFYARKKDACATQINVAARDCLLVADGEEIPANYATINNKIYFLQEVGE